jgi:hypothetical protein
VRAESWPQDGAGGTRVQRMAVGSGAMARGGARAGGARLISVLQGWDVTGDELAAQIAQSRAGSSAGTLVCGAVIDQSFWPVEAVR